jgi:hypothetical protein
LGWVETECERRNYAYLGLGSHHLSKWIGIGCKTELYILRIWRPTGKLEAGQVVDRGTSGTVEGR